MRSASDDAGPARPCAPDGGPESGGLSSRLAAAVGPLAAILVRFVRSLGLAGLAGLAIAAGPAGATVAANGAPGPIGETREMVVFVREGCPHCAAARRYLAEVARERPWLTIVYRDVEYDDLALDDLLAIALGEGRSRPAVPTFVLEGRVMIGFATPELSGAPLLAFIDASAPAARPTVPAATGPSASPLFGLAMGLVDGVNACVMWALLYLLSMLLHLRARARIAVLAGAFVAANVAIHGVLLAAWIDLFAFARLSGPFERVAGAIGVCIGLFNVKEAAWPGHGPSLSVPAWARPRIGVRMRRVLAARSLAIGLAAVLALALLVNVVELLCTAGFPAVYAAEVARQAPGPQAARLQFALYLVGYAAPSSALAAAAVALLSSPKLTLGAGRWLKLLSGVAILVLGLPMLIPRG